MPLEFSEEYIENLNTEDTVPEKSIYIFFSFDLVGSTKFKTEENTKEIWSHVIFRFYEMIFTELKDKIPQVVVWKYLGDEVLLYVSIQDFESDSVIYSIPDIVFNVQGKVAKDIQEIVNTKRLDIKSTIWIAGVQSVKSKGFNKNDIPKPEECYKNLRMLLNSGERLLTDFLGPDMDIGFRVSKFAYHHKVTVSADFAYLLFRMKKPKNMKNIDGKMKIVSFEILKGVWDNKHYPIIWYYPDWKCAEKDFLYADHKENEIVDRILMERIYAINELERVYEELEKTEYIESFIEECIDNNASKNREAFVISG